MVKSCIACQLPRILDFTWQNVRVIKKSLKEWSPAEEFAPVAMTFRGRLLVGFGSASLVAVGANFGELPVFFWGFRRRLAGILNSMWFIQSEATIVALTLTKDLVEFIYPADWVGDQTLLYQAAKELERSLDPPPLNGRRHPNTNEPVVAFGPHGSSGELNVSVIVSPVPQDFSIEAFEGPEDVGEAVIRSITGSTQRPDVEGRLIKASVREDFVRKAKYYELEFGVESPSFRQHDVAVCCAAAGRLFTLNAQAPESGWPALHSHFYTIAHSFTLTP